MCSHSLQGDGRFPASYPIAELKGKKGTQPLDPNHSHFILIDDGSRDTFGGEIKWRADFEKFLMEHEIESIDTSHEDPNKPNQPGMEMQLLKIKHETMSNAILIFYDIEIPSTMLYAMSE